MTFKKFSLKAISVILALAMLIACVPMLASADETTIRLGVFSDVHYYADSLKGDRGEAYREFLQQKHKEYDVNNSLVDNALDGILQNALENGANYVLIPGDLTKDGELEAHKVLAAKLEKFQSETGIPVFVTNGNHDVNNSNACTFENGVKEPAEKTSPEQFREIYANLGFDKADSFFTPKAGNKGGMLSYAADLGDAYRLIVVDSCMYSEDNGAEGDEHLTDGRIGDDLLEWVLAEAKKATDGGKEIILMQHHNLIPHMEIEDATLWAFVVQEWTKIADAYADAGIHYVFTGHLHSSDINEHVSDNGETVYDILTPTLTGYPNTYRTVDFSTDGKNITAKFTNHDIDEYKKVVSDYGVEYDKPFKFTYSFERTFGEGDVSELVMGMIGPMITNLFEEINEQGGIIKYLAASNIDLEKIIVDALGTDGLAIGNMDILTVSGNVMSFINDLGSQVDEVYINQPELTLDKIETILNKLLDFEVSEYPCTYNGALLGSNYEYQGGCTLGQFATTVLLTYYAGDEDISDLPFVKDTLEGFDSGKTAEEFFNLLREVVVNDLVEDEILANLDFNPGALFPNNTLFYVFGRLLQNITESLLGGDNSFTNLIDTVLSLPVVPEGYNSIDEIIDTLVVDEYLTFSQFESWGGTIAWMVSTMIIDSNPDEKCDNNVTLTYTGPVEVEATKENFRLPANVVMTLGEDSSTEVNITWLSKYSLTSTDFEVVPYSDSPSFEGRTIFPDGVTAYSTSEAVLRSYPGADLGIFGLLPYETEYVMHTVTLTGLEPGTKYCYRVGNTEKGWWSDTGVIETASGDDSSFTFFYLSDPQAQRPSHYETYNKVLKAATGLYPDAKFVVSGGDQVDLGTNSKHWNYFFNSTDAFLNMPFMPTTGNHEDSGYVLKNNFTLPNVPEQDEDTGTYYSYDYNDVHFTVLNTNDIVDDKLSDEQLDWLIDDIKGSDAKWKIVVLHKALYSNGSHYDDDEVIGMRSQLSALLPYLGVDLVLQGHDHVYLRTDAMKANAVIPVRETEEVYNGLTYNMKHDPCGTIYGICGTSGVKVYATKDVEATDELFPRAEAIIDSEYPMFSSITVDGDALYYNAYQVIDGEAKRVDNFAVEKTEDKAPTDNVSDKAEGIDNLITKLLSKLNIKLTWKCTQFLYNVVNKVMQLVWSVVK